MNYRVEMSSSAVRDINGISPRYRAAVIEFVYGPLAEDPEELGGARLHGGLAGSWSACRGGYRVLYTILDDKGVALVHRIAHPAATYGPRVR
jgi:mRNA-degrading endonuclease RelE of RelBE toxin-antitoxin system